MNVLLFVYVFYNIAVKGGI